jgi:hypothetical protein
VKLDSSKGGCVNAFHLNSEANNFVKFCIFLISCCERFFCKGVLLFNLPL